MKGEIIEIKDGYDDFAKHFYQITILFEDMPDLKLGKCEIVQK